MMMTENEWVIMLQTLQHMGFHILHQDRKTQTILIRPQPTR